MRNKFFKLITSSFLLVILFIVNCNFVFGAPSLPQEVSEEPTVEDVTMAYENCKEIEDYTLQRECIDDIKRSVKGEEYLQKQKSASEDVNSDLEIDICIESKDVECFAKLAIEKQDIAICNEIVGPDDIGKCEVFFYLPRYNKNFDEDMFEKLVESCHKNTDTNGYYYCKMDGGQLDRICSEYDFELCKDPEIFVGYKAHVIDFTICNQKQIDTEKCISILTNKYDVDNYLNNKLCDNLAEEEAKEICIVAISDKNEEIKAQKQEVLRIEKEEEAQELKKRFVIYLVIVASLFILLQILIYFAGHKLRYYLAYLGFIAPLLIWVNSDFLYNLVVFINPTGYIITLFTTPALSRIGDIIALAVPYAIISGLLFYLVGLWLEKANKNLKRIMHITIAVSVIGVTYLLSLLFLFMMFADSS